MLLFLTTIGTVLDAAFAESARLALRERTLEQTYQLLNASAINASGRLFMPLPINLPDPGLALPNSGQYAFVVGNDDKLLWRSPSLLERPIPKAFALKVGEKNWQDITLDDGKDYYLFGLGFQRTLKSGVYAFNFYLMTELDPLNKQVEQYRYRLWGGLALAALLLLVTQTWALHWGLKPLRKVSHELNAIETGGQDQIKGRYPKEVKQLSDRINSLLAQERARQTRYRNALADLAHSLKTPLAVLRASIDQPEVLRGAVDEQSTRMMHIVERQLQRAGAAGNAAAAPPLAVKPIVDRLIASLNKVHRHKDIAVANRLDPSLSLRCDEADLIEILGNLLDNAYKWCGSQVAIHSQTAGHKLTLSIHDDGLGISQDHINHILQRGGRMDENTPGHGIGLSVAADIIEAYQGQLTISTSFLGGAAVAVEFPD